MDTCVRVFVKSSSLRSSPLSDGGATTISVQVQSVVSEITLVYFARVLGHVKAETLCKEASLHMSTPLAMVAIFIR
jgi:hypothetical protein